MDGAVIAYGQLVGGEDGLKHQPDFARVLAMNALILRRYGDPALAVASADAATQLFLQLAYQINESPQSLSYARYLCTATAVSAGSALNGAESTTVRDQSGGVLGSSNDVRFPRRMAMSSAT